MKYYRKRFRRPFRKPYRKRNLAKTDYGTHNAGKNNMLTRMTNALRFGTSAFGLARSIGWAVKNLASVINTEKKAYDTTSTSFAVPLADVTVLPAFCLTTIAQGTTESTRIGNSILIKSIQSRFSLEAVSPNRVRMIIVRDMQCNGVNPTLNLVLEDATNFDSPLNIINGNAEARFSVIADRVFTLYENKPIISETYYSKTQIHANYLGSTDAITDLGQNQIFVFVFREVADNAVAHTAYWRTRYIDN